MVGKLKSTEMVDNFMDPPPKQIKLGMVFIFILPLVPDRDMPAIALFFESNIAAPIP